MKLIINICFFLIVTCSAFAQKNLVYDGEFETGTEKLNGTITNPDNNMWFGQTKDVAESDGFQIEKIDLNYNQRVIKASFGNVKNRSTYLCQNVTGFESNKRYLVGFWYKTDSPTSALRVEARAHNYQDGKIIFNKKQLGSLEINSLKRNIHANKWKYYSFTLNTNNIDRELLGQKYVRLLFFFNQSFASGAPILQNPEKGQYQYYITDVSIKELPLYVSNSDFERWDTDVEPAELADWKGENAILQRVTGLKKTDSAVRVSTSSDKNGYLLSAPLKSAFSSKCKVSFWAKSTLKKDVISVSIYSNGKMEPQKLTDNWKKYTLFFDSPKDKAIPELRFSLSKGRYVDIDNITIE